MVPGSDPVFGFQTWKPGTGSDLEKVPIFLSPRAGAWFAAISPSSPRSTGWTPEVRPGRRL